ncbi:MAG: hypothetical protein JWM27_4369 [Gemmatimonadetes bacterium]|nr:hypothetical protein [Gemmatimonadota bacterium]
MPTLSRALPLLAILAAACAPAARPLPAQAPAAARTAEDVVRAMHDRYVGRWYRTLSFTQRTSKVMPGDSVHVDMWREWSSIPGTLRIEMGAPADGNGALFARDSAYAIRAGQVVRRAGRRNPLTVVGFDVYAQDVARTVAVLREEGFAMDRMHEDTWQGRPVYVVGAAAGDVTSKQFWVDRERLLFVRLLEPGQPPAPTTQDIRFDEYQPFGGGWVAMHVNVYDGPKRIFWEEYTDVKVNEPLDPGLFDPDHLSAPPAPRP